MTKNKRVKRKIALIIALLLVSALAVPSFSGVERVIVPARLLNGDTLYVGGVGPNNYSRIQDAIDDASAGDTIFVYNGVYHENIEVYKSLSLIGQNKNSTIIDAEGCGDVAVFTADNISIRGFTLQNGGYGHDYLNDACIEVLSNNNVIQNTRCLYTNYGIWVRDSTGNLILNNFCYNEYDGIWLINSGNNTIVGNEMHYCSLVLDGMNLSDFYQTIEGNTANGKPIYYYKNEHDITVPSDAGGVILVKCGNFRITGLDISHVTDGIELLHSAGNVVCGNKITDTVDFGIRLVKSDGNTIKDNYIANNPYGIGFSSGGTWLYDMPSESNHNTIKYNTIEDNIYYGIYFDNSDDNAITKNDLMGNGKSVYFVDSFNNCWTGNYWDDWIGFKYQIFSFLPKIIEGRRHMFWTFPERTMPWWNVDWSPNRVRHASLRHL